MTPPTSLPITLREYVARVFRVAVFHLLIALT
jgi:hypothetical protein